MLSPLPRQPPLSDSSCIFSFFSMEWLRLGMGWSTELAGDRRALFSGRACRRLVRKSPIAWPASALAS